MSNATYDQRLEVCPECEDDLQEDMKYEYYCPNCGWRHVYRTR